MRVSALFNLLSKFDVDFFAGVPDSQLQQVCQYLESNCVNSNKNWVVPNEGMAVAVAAGHYIATKKPACVYMQNSGIGNAVNPICSLTAPEIYGIPIVYIIGWRGTPGVKDEPQHVFQGEITPGILDLMRISYVIIEPDTDEDEFIKRFIEIAKNLSKGMSIAVLVKKGAFKPEGETIAYTNGHKMVREAAIECILRQCENSIVVSSTGKISREVFEVRESLGHGHEKDFLTVGSMGHCSSIALAIAVENPKRSIVVIDGDGAVLMHMGALALIGSSGMANITHVMLDNHAHETVGSIPTISGKIDFCQIAKACGYARYAQVDNVDELTEQMKRSTSSLSFIRAFVSLDSRANLGRPTRTPEQNKNDLMNFLGA